MWVPRFASGYASDLPGRMRSSWAWTRAILCICCFCTVVGIDRVSPNQNTGNMQSGAQSSTCTRLLAESDRHLSLSGRIGQNPFSAVHAHTHSRCSVCCTCIRACACLHPCLCVFACVSVHARVHVHVVMSYPVRRRIYAIRQRAPVRANRLCPSACAPVRPNHSWVS